MLTLAQAIIASVIALALYAYTGATVSQLSHALAIVGQ